MDSAERPFPPHLCVCEAAYAYTAEDPEDGTVSLAVGAQVFVQGDRHAEAPEGWAYVLADADSLPREGLVPAAYVRQLVSI